MRNTFEIYQRNQNIGFRVLICQLAMIGWGQSNGYEWYDSVLVL